MSTMVRQGTARQDNILTMVRQSKAWHSKARQVTTGTKLRQGKIR